MSFSRGLSCTVALVLLAFVGGCSAQPGAQRFAADRSTPSPVAVAPSSSEPLHLTTSVEPHPGDLSTPRIPYASSVFSGPTAPHDLRVMTFNLRVPFILDGLNFWEFRKGLTRDTIKNFNPD